MNQARRNWSPAPFSMWRIEYGNRLGGTASRNNPLARRIDGVRLTDGDTNLIYEAVIERENGRARLTGVTILTTLPGQRIDQETIRRVPVQRIAEQASLQLEAQDDAGMAVFTTGGAHRSPHDGPTVEEVALDHKEGLNRVAISERRKVSVYTVDKRLAEARRLKLIPPATTGRPRKPAPLNDGQRPTERRRKSK